MAIDGRLVQHGAVYLYHARKAHLGINYPIMHSLIHIPVELIEFVMDNQRTVKRYDIYCNRVTPCYRFSSGIWEWDDNRNRMPSKKFRKPAYLGHLKYYTTDIIDDELRELSKLKDGGTKVWNDTLWKLRDDPYYKGS